MKITLLDPGLASTRGHHFDLDLRLARALARLGHVVEVHGRVHPDPRLLEMAEAEGMALRSTFRVPTYAALAQAQPPLEAYEQMADATAADLAKVPGADLWFWPTLAPYQFAAALSHDDSVRQLGGLWWTPRFPHAVGARSWARSARRLVHEKKPITVGAYDQALCRACKSFSPELEVARLPCPHDGAANDRQPTVLRRIGFFGHQRASRGLAILPELVTALVRRGFQVVVQDSNFSIQGKGTHPNIEVLHFVPDFAAEIARCDLVIWPSRWEAYLESHSGVARFSTSFPSTPSWKLLIVRRLSFRPWSPAPERRLADGMPRTAPIALPPGSTRMPGVHRENGARLRRRWLHRPSSCPGAEA